ncbi:MAG: hypothetical protein ACD_17C00068G0003 [uncultured bacterium]|nr:MAG: hypothetical protein ACD_17C00068G0003 [uncultured bacterium]OGN55177.1 MAG: hypothetical protein A2796_05360 [Chlamydiae bacterium RIFCSPHIGHO2_01_FULL_44_39]OGN59582.1 MAG: hypothetical protein A3D96_06535 [Chlamydiae bacterium RIFCSPHIGHO2_12_FULL_44_59]OGN68438.1 MAG: hypothetical protein A3I67_06645 [Chlamydiae bacterium RIFCSPLOWO2_02_FULL_45_22]
MTRIAEFSNWSYEHLEKSLLPAQGSITKRVASYAIQFFQFCCFLPLSGLSSVFSGLENWISPRASIDTPLVAFSKKPPPWSGAAPLPNIPWGTATAAFHDNGPLVHNKTNFGELYLKHHPERFDRESHFPNMWEHPERWVDRLVEIGAKTFRFSVPRDLIEPREGNFDAAALQKVIDLCTELQHRNIVPMVTLEHFSRPLYQTFETDEGIESFVNYATTVSERLYAAGVRKILTFNEVGVEPFQGYIMGEFPPYHKVDFEGAARFFTNMMKAHTKVYRALKQLHPDFEIGFSHDPIRFRYFHKMHPVWSPIERIVSKYLTDVNHTMVMTCLKTGNVQLKVPFFSNYSAQLDETPPFDFLGLQYYTDPCVKLSMFGGASITRVPNEKITAYCYRQYPQGLASAIEELSQFGKPLDLTEVGIDTGINKNDGDVERIAYFEKILQVVQKALDEGKNVRSLYFWTLIDNFDWHQGWDLPTHCPIRFGFYKFDPTRAELTPRPIVQWIKQKAGVL